MTIASAKPTLADLRTERLVLEPLVASHAAKLFTALADGRLYTFIPQDPPPNLRALEERFDRLEARRSPDGTQRWLNWSARANHGPREQRDDGDAYVGLFQATVEGNVAHVAYFVFSAWQRRGFAREGLSAIMPSLVASDGVRSFVAEIDTRNVASITLVRSLGFVLERTTANADWFKGASSDEHRFVREA